MPSPSKGAPSWSRMVGIVGDGDVLAEERFAQATRKAGALVGNGGSGEIVEEKTDEIEDGGGFEDHREAAGRKFDGILRTGGFFAGGLGKLKRIELADVGRVRFGPTCGGALLHGDGKVGLRLPVGGDRVRANCQARSGSGRWRKFRRQPGHAFPRAGKRF